MVVISLKRLTVSLLMIIASTVLLAVCGLALKGGEDWYLKLELQNFFFWGVVALGAQIIIGASLLLSHRKIIRSIKRLSALEDLNSANAEKMFRDMGVIGKEIRAVLGRANQLSILRADRISALNNLTNLLCEGYSEPVMVTDVNGVILSVSEKLKTRIAKESEGAVINNILELRPDIKLPEVLGFIEKQKTVWRETENSGLVCTPVFDKNSTVQFCIWEFETSLFAVKLKELNQQKSKIKPTYKKMKDFLNPFLKGKKQNGA